MGKARNRKMSMAFDGWYSMPRSHTQSILGKQIINRLINSQHVKAFTTWQRKFYAAKARRARFEEDPITRQMRRIVKMSNCFERRFVKMEEYVYLLKKYERIVQKTMRKWRFKTLSNALDGWISKVAETKRHRQLLARASRRWQNKVVAAVCTRWFEYTTERKENRVKVSGFV